MLDFDVIPAIDLLDAECVRLTQGRYDEATVYGSDPGAVAAGFACTRFAGCTSSISMVRRREGPCNEVAIRAIVKAVGEIPVQLGGGIRTLESVESALAMGVSRVILGTVALKQPALVREAAKRFPEQIVVGIDARDGRVAVEGWLDTSEASALDLARKFEDAGVAAIIYTDIARDGMLSGPNLESTVDLAQEISIPVIVSGGVSRESDIVEAARCAPSGIAGVIVGRALYTGAVDLPKALEAVAAIPAVVPS